VQIGAITIRKKGKFEQSRLPRQETVSSPAPQSAQKPSGSRTGLILVICAAVLLAAVIGAFSWGLILKNGDTIYPNVYVADINVGKMTAAQATAAVEDAVAATYASSTLQVQLPDRTLSFNPDQTGVALDANEVIARALAHGRSGNPFAVLKAYFTARSTEHYIDLQTILELDTNYIRQLIAQVAEDVKQEPVPSAMDYNSTTGLLTVSTGVPAVSLDADALYGAVYDSFLNGNFAVLPWNYDVVPCEPIDLQQFYDTHCTDMQNAYYDEQTHTIVKETVGYGFDLEAAAQQLAQAPAGSELRIQLMDLEPEVTAEVLEQTMFGEALFVTASTYEINANRTNNLRLACEAIDGTILNPGEVFSFNDIVGERTDVKGYLGATVYAGNGASETQLGGGVCQVASTIYYATLHLNMEQVEREPHMYAVSYVPMGMDATVYWGSIDYRFRNTLSNPVKILAWLENGKVNITFLGVKETDNRVEMSYHIIETIPWEEVEEVDEEKEPGFREEVQTPYTGYKVVTYKTVTDKDGNRISREEEAYSEYRKRDKKFIVGPTPEDVPPEEDPDVPDNPDVPDDPFETDDPDLPVTPDDPFGTDNPEVPENPDTPEDPFDPGTGESDTPPEA